VWVGSFLILVDLPAVYPLIFLVSGIRVDGLDSDRLRGDTIAYIAKSIFVFVHNLYFKK